MKNIAKIIFIALALGATTCRTMLRPNKDISDGWVTGTVKYVPLEGGFYGILGNKGDKYDPVNLPDSFKKDGLPVKFRMEELPDQVSFHMWGKLVNITDIKRL